jgi:hypothetical protein
VVTNDTNELLEYALPLVDQIYAPDVEFKKAGIIMLELQPEDSVQTSLFDTKDRTNTNSLNADYRYLILNFFNTLAIKKLTFMMCSLIFWNWYKSKRLMEVQPSS